MRGKIIICPTPIGNLSDISNRALDALKSADIIYAEDTRVSSKLLSNFSISAKIKRLDENTMQKNLDCIIQECNNGKSITYVTDAGMPGVSDPGLRLVASARKNSICVEVLPGPCAAIVAYVASGFINQNFYFGAFLSKKENQVKQTLEALKDLDSVLIFYESPNRLVKSLAIISELFPDRDIAVCRELTKIHEEIVVDNSNLVFKEFKDRDNIKGEIVIVINSPSKISKSLDNSDAIKLAEFLSDKELKTSEISDALQISFNMPKNESYRIALNAKK